LYRLAGKDFSIRACVRALLLALILLAVSCEPLLAQQKSYWLSNSNSLVGSCPGKSDGDSLRAANGEGQWVLITASITCRDVGDAYTFVIDYMSVQINPSSRERIEREVLNFDWIALSVMQPKGLGDTVNWLYDEALPIRGALEKASREKIYFGNLTFPKIAKSDLAKATNFTFYMTSQGIPFVFGLK
jgi:hypothetical protein